MNPTPDDRLRSSSRSGAALDASSTTLLMDEALSMAHAAAALGNIPVGAAVMWDGAIIASAHNLRHTLGDPTAHAELIALRRAAQVLGRWRLDDCTLAVTLEPCAMCAGAIGQARVGRLIYGAREPKTGAVESKFHLLRGGPTAVFSGHDSERCLGVMADFFQRLRST